MINHKDTKAYIAKIKALLPIYSKSERQFIQRLSDNIDGL